MVDEVYVFSFVEDEPSRDALVKVVEWHNASGGRNILFREGFPKVTGGFGAIKTRCPTFLKMAKSGQYTLTLTDLDRAVCPSRLIGDWFFPGRREGGTLPPQTVFRIAVREVESWILADREGLAKFLGISKVNFTTQPETLPDPKEHLFGVLRSKARKKRIRGMLPTGSAYIGPTYNDVLCEFINTAWSIERAYPHAPSLERALKALARI